MLPPDVTSAYRGVYEVTHCRTALSVCQRSVERSTTTVTRGGHLYSPNDHIFKALLPGQAVRQPDRFGISQKDVFVIFSCLTETDRHPVSAYSEGPVDPTDPSGRVQKKNFQLTA